MRVETFLGIRIQQFEIKTTINTIDLMQDKLDRLLQLPQTNDVNEEISRVQSNLELFQQMKAQQERIFKDTEDQLRRLIEDSNDIEAKCLLLRFVEGKKYADIERELNYSIDHIKRVCGRLSKKIESIDYDSK